MNKLEDAETATLKWLNSDIFRSELLRMAVLILEHRRGGLVCANDAKAAWAFLCRNPPKMASAASVLPKYFTTDADDSDDSSYVYESENEYMSVEDPQEEEEEEADSSGSESEMHLDEQHIALGPDSENESDEEKEEGTRGVEISPLDIGEQEMTENVSLVANALLESVAPPEVFNQLQVI